jgi:hypothetical protein
MKVHQEIPEIKKYKHVSVTQVIYLTGFQPLIKMDLMSLCKFLVSLKDHNHALIDKKCLKFCILFQ